MFQQPHCTTTVGLPALVSAYRDIAVGYVEAKQVQVDAPRRRLFCSGVPLGSQPGVCRAGHADDGHGRGKIVEDIRAGRTPGQPQQSVPIGPTGPPVNQELVKPHRKMLEDNVGLAFFGL